MHATHPGFGLWWPSLARSSAKSHPKKSHPGAPPVLHCLSARRVRAPPFWVYWLGELATQKVWVTTQTKGESRAAPNLPASMSNGMSTMSSAVTAASAASSPSSASWCCPTTKQRNNHVNVMHRAPSSHRRHAHAQSDRALDLFLISHWALARRLACCSLPLSTQSPPLSFSEQWLGSLAPASSHPLKTHHSHQQTDVMRRHPQTKTTKQTKAQLHPHHVRALGQLPTHAQSPRHNTSGRLGRRTKAFDSSNLSSIARSKRS